MEVFETRTVNISEEATIEYEGTISVPSNLSNEEAGEWIIENNLLPSLHTEENKHIYYDPNSWKIDVRKEEEEGKVV